MMKKILAAIAIAAGCAALFAYPVQAAPQSTAAVNRGVIQLETGPADDISVRMAEEIARIIDDGSTRRVIPIVGKGPVQNLIDLRYLRGIDLAIVQTDALDYARQQNLVSGLDSLTYVAKLHNAEFHLLARPEIKAIGDLAGKIVNVDIAGSSTSITAARLFDLLKINAKIATDSQLVALDKLRAGEIAALAVVTAKPAPFFGALKSTDGLHLLGVPFTPTLIATYAPTAITATDYPDLVAIDHPADTIAVGNALVAADLRMLPERQRNLNNFVDALYTGFQALLGTGYDPKWREVNIAADVPGWTRHPAAAAWLRHNPQIAAAPNTEVLKALFSRFIDQHRLASGGTPMSAPEKNALFQQFEAWQRAQSH
jgi:TRAP-type uncharacterized transport system substrate-binding protein